MPWATYKLDSRGLFIKDAAGNPKLEGYCVEFVEEMSKKMNFEYELIVPTDNTENYGRYRKMVINKNLCHMFA